MKIWKEKTLERPLDCKEIKPVHPKGNQPWIVIGRTDWTWSFNPLATWCKESTYWKRPLTLGKIEGRRRRGWQRARWLDGITKSTDMSMSKLWKMITGKPGVLQSMRSQRVRHNWATEQQQQPPLSPDPLRRIQDRKARASGEDQRIFPWTSVTSA